jgi:hypothetical protein
MLSGCVEEPEETVVYSQYIIPFNHEIVRVKDVNNTTIRIDIIGQVKNAYNETLTASIRGHFLDKEGNKLGMDEVNQGLNNWLYVAESGEEWNFTLVYDGADLDKVDDVVFTEMATLDS